MGNFQRCKFNLQTSLNKRGHTCSLDVTKTAMIYSGLEVEQSAPPKANSLCIHNNLDFVIMFPIQEIYKYRPCISERVLAQITLTDSQASEPARRLQVRPHDNQRFEP